MEAGTRLLSLTDIPPSCRAELVLLMSGESGLVFNGVTHFTDTKHEDSEKLNIVKCRDTILLTPNSLPLPTPIAHDANNCCHLDCLWLISCLGLRRLQLQNVSTPSLAPLLLCPASVPTAPSPSLELGWESSVLRDKPQPFTTPVGLPVTGTSEGNRPGKRDTVVTRPLPGVEGTEHDCRW